MTCFRPALKHIVDLVQDCQVHHCLLDLHGLPDISIEDQVWLTINWLPRILRQYARQVALVLPAAHHYNQMVVEGLLKIGRPFITFEVQFFSDTHAALDWLTNSTEQVDKLEQEWSATQLHHSELGIGERSTV
ncbi:hypothetical protein [Hymenobacter elongatus]|uniref:STAS/SEC14 domain-containing protein n=1 Tax=Hymenobacter elongatus TaxID=877208 RepID=A0A4Z0PQL5_9BACT|nr:hypothetical protein [Hymenobacter elongatus]TGE19639.1 hypothetical protein E5J99_02455 [Hymenobacter elongatus]